MTSLFWTFSIISLIVFFLIFIIRKWTISWSWNLGIILILIYFGMFYMLSRPRNAWMFSSVEGIHGEVEILYSKIMPKKYIILLIQDKSENLPFYLFLPWSKESSDQLNKAKMIAEQRRSSVMADIDKISKNQFESNEDTKDIDIDENNDNTKKNNGKGTKLNAAKGDHPKDGGRLMFYPAPQKPEPLKTPIPNITIQ